MPLDASVGYLGKRYVSDGERIVTLQGRSYVYTARNGQGIQWGNVMSEKLGIAYQVPTGKKLTAYAFRTDYAALTSQDVITGLNTAFIPIGTGSDPTNTANYTTIAHIDITPDNIDVVGNNWEVEAASHGDCTIEWAATAYPKVGTVGRSGAPDPPTRAVSADVQLVCIEGAA